MISVVIPLYNKEQSIQSTIESVLSQTYQDFELIVVDDGSTDKSADIVDSFSDKRIRLIRKENGGVSSARNAGIRAANLEYIAFLDGDDLWDKEFLSEIVKLIKAYPEAGIFGTSYSSEKTGIIERHYVPLEDGYFGIVDNHKWDKAYIYCASSVCCRKDALEEIGLFDENLTYGEDSDVWWRIMLNYPAAFSNRSLATYRFDAENRAMEKTIPLNKLHLSHIEKYEDARKKDDCFRHFFDKECMRWLYLYILENPRDKDIKRIISQINFREYKLTFWFRLHFPKAYCFVKKLV